MLNDIVSIKLMDIIFKECGHKVSVKSMMLYQNILNHHFSKLEEERHNLKEFTLEYEEIPNVDKYLVHLHELVLAGICDFTTEGIVFLDVWSKHVSPSRFVKHDTIRNVSDFQESMMKSDMLIDAVAMRLHLSKKDVNDLMLVFFTEQEAIGRFYINELECRKHFLNWCQHHPIKEQKQIVKSTSKILGF